MDYKRLINSIKNIVSYLKRNSKILFSRIFENWIFKQQRKRIQHIFNSNNEIILVYSIGKVGSATIYNSIKNSNLIDIPIFHVHSLLPERINEQKIYYKSSNRKSIPFHLIQSSALTEFLKDYSGKIYIITLIREPISRELSSLYQDSFNFTKSINISKSLMPQVIDSKLNELVNELPEIEWFDRELKQVFNIDIFENNFDPKIGYFNLLKSNLNFTLIRLEDLNANFDQISKLIFNLQKPIKLLTKNTSNKKFYHESYAEIKSEILLPTKKIEKIINTNYIQKFYPDYIAILKEKWEIQN